MDRETWYLLFDGQSVDGTGLPDYVGRTTSKDLAAIHYGKVNSDPYCTGKVVIITDKEHRTANQIDRDFE